MAEGASLQHMAGAEVDTHIEPERWLAREWFSAAELADMKIGGLPATERGVRKKAAIEGWPSRERTGRGGGREFHMSALPSYVQIKLALDQRARVPADGERESTLVKAELKRDELWRWFEAQPEKKKEKARLRLEILATVMALWQNGTPKDVAAMATAKHYSVGVSSIYNWFALVAGRERDDWLPALAPRHAGRTATIECDADAWEMLKSDYLRLESPRFSDCYYRMTRAAEARGWSYPSERTLLRRLSASIAPAVIVLAREGADAVKRMYPAQERDRSIFHALQAVNADGHRWDVWVKFPDGEVRRPCMVAFQDLYSGKILAWRVDKTENAGCVRLAFGDLIEAFGVPELCWLDNGRNFASKWLTGGTPNRYRFTVREEDPLGILTQLGIEVHWTQPYSGQSKPIERAFRDFAGNIAKHPAFAGAYTGNTPIDKPENYGSKAIPLETFLEIAASEIRAHNARPGRQSRVCGGVVSFDEAFGASYSRAPIKKATEEQRRLWLLAAEGVTVASRDGSVRLLGNRYWADFLHLHLGEKVAARFDPDYLHDGLHIYRLDGAYLGHAPVIDPAGFDSADKAREHARLRKRKLRAWREILEVERQMSPMAVADLVPPFSGGDQPEAKVVQLARPVHDLKRAPSRDLTPEQEERRNVLVANFGQSVEPTAEERQRSEARDRFARALRIEVAFSEGGDAGEGEVQWLRGYQQTPEYRSQKSMREDFGEGVA